MQPFGLLHGITIERAKNLFKINHGGNDFMKFKEYLKRGLCLSLAASLLLTGCASTTPESKETSTNTTNTTQQPENEETVSSISQSDKDLVASLKDKYGAATVDYTEDVITVARNENIEIQLGFDALEKEMGKLSDYFTVYQDAEMQYPLDCFYEYDYKTNTLIIKPPTFGVAELYTASGSDIDLSDLSGSFLYDDETGDDWGNLGKLYLVQKLDTETGEELETPSITIMEVDTELDEAPVAEFTCNDDGVATINWTPVEGATEYVLFVITKYVGEDMSDPGFNAYSYAIARTTDTTWSAPTHVFDYTGDVISMNDIFENYITSQDDEYSGMENMNEDFFETMVDHVGVIAITENGSSPVSNMCSLKTYSKLLPQAWAWNQNAEEVGSAFCSSVDLLPAEVNITMCDGTTSKRVIEYDFDNYVLNEDGTRVDIPSKASGTLLSETYTAVVDNPDTLEADLQKIKERQEKLKNKGGAVDKGTEIQDETEDQTTETTSGDAEVTEPEETTEPETTEPEETTIPEVTEPEETTTPEATEPEVTEPEETTTPEVTEPEETTAPQNSELDTDMAVTANSALSEYIAIQLLNSREVIDLSPFTESKNEDIVADAYLEAKYQNPLVMGIQNVGYDSTNHLLYVEYDDEPEVTAQKREDAKAKAKEVVAQIITEDMSDLDKEIAINQYLCDNATYDNAALESAEKYNYQNVDAEFNDSFTPYGVLINGVGVCASYAGAFKVLADEAGLECIVVAGYLEGNLSHAWNRVKIDGKWLSVDSTNNDNEVIQNALLNISDTGANGVLVEDERFILDEKRNDYKGDTDDKEYYRINGKYFPADAIVDKLVEELNADGDAMLRSDYDIDDTVFQTILNAVATEMGESVKGYHWLGVLHLTK